MCKRDRKMWLVHFLAWLKYATPNLEYFSFIGCNLTPDIVEIIAERGTQLQKVELSYPFSDNERSWIKNDLRYVSGVNP